MNLIVIQLRPIGKGKFSGGGYSWIGRVSMTDRTLGLYGRAKQMIGSGTASMCLLSGILLLVLCGSSFAQGSGVQRNNWLSGVIFKLEGIRDNATADIQRSEREIEKSESTIRRSEEIIRQAQQKKNIQAEMVARQASRTAQVAIKKNQEMKKLGELKKRRAEEALVYIKTGGKDPEAKLEQFALEDSKSEWTKKQKELIEKRLTDNNPFIEPIYQSLKTNAPPPLPARKYDELKPGDVLLINPEEKNGKSFWEKVKDNAKDSAFWINAGDRISSASSSPASHTVLYLKEVNGKKLFLDHTPEKGSRVISEDEFRKTYGHRDALVAQPVKEIDTVKIWEAAKELSKREAQIKTKKSDNIIDQSGYGVYGNDNMVCSEVSRWALVNSGLKLPESVSPLKRLLGIHYGPANFFSDDKNFIITPLYAPAQKTGHKIEIQTYKSMQPTLLLIYKIG